jgi:chromate transport protein ChrA
LPGIRVCVCVLIFNAVWKLLKGAVIDKLTFIIFLVVLLLSSFTDAAPANLVVAAGIVGLIAKKIGGALLMNLYLQLFYEFAKTGLFAIGGGMATIPFLTKMSDKTGWFTHMELLNMIAVSESTPGPIGVNMASYVGYHLAGVQRQHCCYSRFGFPFFDYYS